MRSHRLLVSAALSSCLVLATFGASAAVAASSSVECGQLSGYTAPDPAGPTDGSLQVGTLAAWDVLATATVSPAAAAALPNAVNAGPTCLALDLDDAGKISAIDFAADGAISGAVAFDADAGFYILAGRLIIPTGITDAYPGLASLFVTSYQAKTNLTVDFSVDTTTGQFVGFDGHAGFCGTATVDADGNGHVGDATILASVLDADDTAALEGAGDRQTCAAIRATGVIDNDNQGAIAVTTDVRITVAAPDSTTIPTAPPTSVAASVPPTAEGSGLAVGVVLLLVVVGTAFAAVRRVRPIH